MGGAGCTVRRAGLCRIPICGNCQSALIGHVPTQRVVEIKLADKSIAYVSQKFCTGDDAIVQGLLLGSVPEFDYAGRNKMKT